MLVMVGPITGEGIPALCERARVLLEGCDAGRVPCDVGELAEPDVVTIDGLARLQLTAKRLGYRVELQRACGELEDLLVLTGLGDVRPCAGRREDASGVEPGG